MQAPQREKLKRILRSLFQILLSIAAVMEFVWGISAAAKGRYDEAAYHIALSISFEIGSLTIRRKHA